MQHTNEHNSYFNEVNFKKFIAIFGALFLFGSLLGCVSSLYFKASNQNVPHWFAIKEIGLPGSKARERYVKSPDPIEFRIYLFHVTNKDEVINGSKPMLQEIGPYVFEEWMQKFNITDNDSEDTLTFNMKKTFIFRPDLSKGLTGNENITMVHPLIMGMALTTNVKRKPMLKVVNKIINAMYHNPTDPFWTGRVMDYLFDGIEIDCTSEYFGVRAVCSLFEAGDIKSVVPLRENFFRFSALGGMNGSGTGTYEVKRGVKNFHDVGRIVSFDNKTEMDVWGGDECNRYEGTDSTVFPPDIQKENGLWSFEPEICMSIGAHYDRESNYHGVPTIRFALDFGDARENKDLECFCGDPPTDCPRRTRDLFDCIDAPLILSLPHFYNADPSILCQFQSGLNPNQNEHAFYMDYERASGSVPNAVKRYQINMDVVPIDEVESMKHLPDVIMPLFWIEEITTSAPLKNYTHTNDPNYQQYTM
ncbi:hypothetical protein HA402_002943 [Bradysia odoriphaga]|nr:hypothetical protein HA402_002943 [Bradysia odoriphaga]